jgi:hypothetical protein
VTCVHVGVLPPTHNWANKICKIVRPKRGLALFTVITRFGETPDSKHRVLFENFA